MQELAVLMKKSGIDVELQLVDLAKPEDLLRGDALLLASGTWNTGGPEGQLNPHMHAFLNGAAKAVDCGISSQCEQPWERRLPRAIVIADLLPELLIDIEQRVLG